MLADYFYNKEQEELMTLVSLLEFPQQTWGCLVLSNC